MRSEMRCGLGWVKLVGHAVAWGIEHSTMARRILALNMPTTRVGSTATEGSCVYHLPVDWW